MDRIPAAADTVEIRSLTEAEALLAEWIAAYRRLEREYSHVRILLEHKQAAEAFDAVELPAEMEYPF